jgi:hypothetical protein
MTKAAATKLQSLLDKQKSIQAKIVAIEAREKQVARKRDTRLKVLVGAAFLSDVEKHPKQAETIKTTLERAIVNSKDREFLKSMGWLASSGQTERAASHHATPPARSP